MLWLQYLADAEPLVGARFQLPLSIALEIPLSEQNVFQ